MDDHQGLLHALYCHLCHLQHRALWAQNGHLTETVGPEALMTALQLRAVALRNSSEGRLSALRDNRRSFP